MTHTYTPLIIEGKIYVVVDAPEEPVPYHKSIHDEILKACTKYETLPEHAPYWKERIGKRVEISKQTQAKDPNNKRPNFETYAIPPQQKQGDEDWKVKFKDILIHADNRTGLETSIFTNEEWDYIRSILG